MKLKKMRHSKHLIQLWEYLELTSYLNGSYIPESKRLTYLLDHQSEILRYNAPHLATQVEDEKIHEIADLKQSIWAYSLYAKRVRGFIDKNESLLKEVQETLRLEKRYDLSDKLREVAKDIDVLKKPME